MAYQMVNFYFVTLHLGVSANFKQHPFAAECPTKYKNISPPLAICEAVARNHSAGWRGPKNIRLT